MAGARRGLLFGLFVALAAQGLAQETQVGSQSGEAEAPLTTSQEEATKMMENWAKQKTEEAAPAPAPEPVKEMAPEAPAPAPVPEPAAPPPPEPAAPPPAPPQEPAPAADEQVESVANRLFNRKQAKDKARSHLEKKTGRGDTWDAPKEEARAVEQKPVPAPKEEKPLTPAERRALAEKQQQQEEEEAEKFLRMMEVERQRAEEHERHHAERDRRSPGRYRVDSGHANKAVLKGMRAEELSSGSFRMFNLEQDIGLNKASRIYNVGAHDVTEMHGLEFSMESCTHISPIDQAFANDVPTPATIRTKVAEEERKIEQAVVQEMTQEEEVVL